VEVGFYSVFCVTGFENLGWECADEIVSTAKHKLQEVLIFVLRYCSRGGVDVYGVFGEGRAYKRI
jgi:hypothetical protein